MAGETVDGTDPDAFAACMERAVARARAGEGPTLIGAMLGRMRGHSEGDDSLKVVPAADLERFRAADPVLVYRERLAAEGILDDALGERLEARIAELVETAIEQAISAPEPAPETAWRDVFAPGESPSIPNPGPSEGSQERLPTGGGVTAGPFHSQNLEGLLTHTAGLLRAAIRDPNPVLFFEHKFLYRRIKEELPEDPPISSLGEAKILREGTDLTLVAYGSSVWTCLRAAERLADEGCEAEVVDLRTLIPFDEETVVNSVRRTGRLLIVHEAQLTGGFGAEVAARVADVAFSWLDAPIRRVAYPDRPVPYARVLEQELLPGDERVIAAARELLAF